MDKNIINIDSNEYIDFTKKQFQEIYDKEIDLFYCNKFRVLSFSKILNESLLWSHYSDSHKRFCIGFNHSKLSKDITSKYDLIRDVFYTDNIVEFKLEDKLSIALNSFFTKSSSWSYEKEIRFVRLTENPNVTSIFDDASIDKIILGINMSNKNVDELIEICKNRKLPLFRILKQKNNLQLLTERIL